MKAVVLHSVVPVRREPSEESEQLTQLLFAETCEVLQEVLRWKYIRNDADGEEGWVDFKMISPLSEQEAEEYLKSDFSTLVFMPMAFAVSENNGQTVPLTAGTRLPNYSDGEFHLLGVSFRIDPSMVSRPIELTEDSFKRVMRFFINVPYLWGGKNALGMDCSGFSSVVMSFFGLRLPRNARQQVSCGKDVPFLQEAKCGDLAFFDHQSRDAAATNISHVGILLSPEYIIHASGRVKVERIDSVGIISTETGEHTHDLRVIRRLI